MATHDSLESGNDQQLSMEQRLLLDRQKRQWQLREQTSSRSIRVICPYFSVVEHSDCRYCAKMAYIQPTTSSTGLLLQKPAQPAALLARPVSNSSRATNIAALSVPALHQQLPAALVPPHVEPYKELEEDFLPVQTPDQFTHFFDLSEEIRHQILAYAVDNGRHGILLSKQMKANYQPPITRVSRQLRKEALDLVYLSNGFFANNRDLCKAGPAFVQSIGDQKCALIRKWKWYTAKRTLNIHISFDGTVPYDISYDGGTKGYERALEVYDVLKNMDGIRSGLNEAAVRKITEIVLRANNKPAPSHTT